MKYRVGGGGAVGGIVRVGESVSRAPPELREWLDAKLQQVGVDPSPAYSRYVLGLLLQPEGECAEEDGGAEEEEALSEGRRRRRRQGKRQENPFSWPGERFASHRDTKVIHSELGKSRKRCRASTGRYRSAFGDGELRKRSAAIDCLMSASDQKSGIEKLVDELCAKLKQIQNEAGDGNSFHLELSHVSDNSKVNVTKFSAQDQAERYYAAFPPLKKSDEKSANGNLTLSFEGSCAWNNRKVLTRCCGRNKKNEVWLSSESVNESYNGENKENVKKKSFGRGDVWGKESTNQGGLRENSGLKCRQQRMPYKARKHCRDSENEDGIGFKNDSVKMVLMMALASSVKPWQGIQRYSLKENDIEAPTEQSGMRRRLYELERSAWEDENAMEPKFSMNCNSEEESLASLFAKFDRRMEALWELEPESDLSQSVSILADLHNRPNTASEMPPPFILSGTNITSSIWSQHPMNDYNPQHLQGICSEGKDQAQDGYNGSKVVGNELKSVAVRTGLASPKLENFRIIWEESTNFFPPQFIGVEKVIQPDSLDSMAEESEQKIQKVEESIVLSPHVCYHMVTRESLEALNHSREESSFTEVVPRISSKCNSCLQSNSNDTKFEWPAPPTSGSSIQQSKQSSEEEEVEEDLLTSARTHFLPIRRLSIDSSSGMSESNSGGVHYEDGTTFSIHSAMEQVSFYRSESGSLFLKEDGEENGEGKIVCKTPKKYMIYKGGFSFKGRMTDQDCCGFLPKFLVRQNEKSCQTDECEEEFVVKASQKSGKEGRCNVIEESEEGDVDFFFPGDANLADDLDRMEQEVEEKSEKPSSNQQSANGPGVARKPDDAFVLDSDSWLKAAPAICQCSSMLTLEQERPKNIWEQKRCSGNCWNKIWKSSPDSPYCMLQQVDMMHRKEGGELQSKLLREELSEEGEQLFADLHMVRQMYLGMEWMSNDEDKAEHEEIEKQHLPYKDILTIRQTHVALRNNLGEKKCMSEDDGLMEKARLKRIPYGCLDYDLLEEIFGPLDSEQMGSLLATSKPPVAPKGMLFSFELEAEWKKNERNSSAKACQNDHKRRRHSSGRGQRRESQQVPVQRRRPCSFFVSDGSCHRSHCRFSHELASVPCRFWGDGSCLRGITCPFLHSSAPSVSSGSPSSPISPPPHRPRKQNYVPMQLPCDSSSLRPVTL